MTETSQRRNLLVCLGLAITIVAVYWPVFHFGFLTFDDADYVTDNPRMVEGLTVSNLIWALTTRRVANWHPLTWVSLMLDSRLFGMWAGRYHLVNVLLHVTNTLLLFVVFQRMTAAPWRSAFVAALFGLHPLHAESVAWIAERKDVLSTCFWMLTLWTYVRYVESPSRGRYWWCVGWYALSLMSKPMGVTLPFVLLLLDYWPLGRTHWAKPAAGKNLWAPPPIQLLKEKFPFFALAAASSAVTYWVQSSMGAASPLKSFPLGMRIANTLLSYVSYMGKAFWPTTLAAFYPPRVQLPASSVMVAGVGLIGLTIAVVWRARHEPWFATGWFWYLGTLVPVIGLVQVGAQSMADRYTYVPLIGLFLMLCWAVPRSVMEQRGLKLITGIVAGAILTACAALSRIQVGYWKDSETLFRHALNVTRDNWLAHNNLGVALKAAGRSREEEIEQYQQALQLRPNYAEADYNLGLALWEMGDLTGAIEHWQRAVQARPHYADAHYNLGVALKGLGRTEEAIHYYELAIQIEPDRTGGNYAEAFNDLGAALWRAGRSQEAIRCFERALQIKPDYAEAHYNLGGALEEEKRPQEAVVHYEQAVRINPDFAKAQNRLTRLRGTQ